MLLNSDCTELKMGFLLCFPASNHYNEVLTSVGGSERYEAWLRRKREEEIHMEEKRENDEREIEDVDTMKKQPEVWVEECLMEMCRNPSDSSKQRLQHAITSLSSLNQIEQVGIRGEYE